MSLRLHRHPLHAAAIAATFALVSCGGGDSGGTGTPSTASVSTPPRPVAQSDLDIAQLLYAGTPRTPVGFSADTAPGTYKYVSTVQLKNTDIDATLPVSAPQYELCTDDWNQAIDWSESSARQAPQYADLVATGGDERFFEFDRVRTGDPDIYQRARIFKCSYLNRADADLRQPEGAAGQLNERPLTGEELRSLSEYLWQFTEYNNAGHVVLKSSGTQSTDALSHTLIIANRIQNGISSGCDRIDVIAWTHTAQSANGSLELGIDTLWNFGARSSAGAVQLCTGS